MFCSFLSFELLVLYDSNMKADKIKALLKICPLSKTARAGLFPALGLAAVLLIPVPGIAQGTGEGVKKEKSGAGETEKEKNKKNLDAQLSGSLPARKTSAGAFLALGHVGPSGFLLGGDFFFGWRLWRFLSLHLGGGAGYVQKRSGINSTMAHLDVTLPVRLAICSHTPRVCPGLDFYISIIPGIGYGVVIPNKSAGDLEAADLNHAINAILGVSLESIRTYGNMDAGVRFGAYLYIDFLKDNETADPWLAYAIFELGVVIRWGKAETPE
jgi:hypothetical protein